MAQYYIGTSGWIYSDWRNHFYPSKLAQKNWLAYYASQFNALEINATFYRFFTDETYKKWHHEVPAHFKFVVKAPRLITHYKQLLNCEGPIVDFEKSAMLLKEKLGLILLQLSPKMPYDLGRLCEALHQFQHPEKVAVEFRNKQWIKPEIKTALIQEGSIFCSVDSEKFKLSSWLTSSTAYVRLHGRTAGYHYYYNLTELKNIAKYLRQLVAHGAQEIYVFFNNDYDANAPYNALTLKELLGGK